MTSIKERLLGAITVMSDEQAERLWEHIVWESIPEEAPDEWDLRMLKEIEEDPDCHAFASDEEVKQVLEGLE